MISLTCTKGIRKIEKLSDSIYSDYNVQFSTKEIEQNKMGLPSIPEKSVIQLASASPIEILTNLIYYQDSNITIILGGTTEILDETLPTHHLSDGLHIGFFTSGTTGHPKLVIKSAKEIMKHIQKKNTIRPKKLCWGLLYDSEKMAGVQVLLSAYLRNEDIYCPDPSESPHSKIDLFSKFEVTALSATPSMYKYLLQFSEFSKLNLVQITLGGESSDSALLKRLIHTFPLANIRQIYASTEIGEIFTVRDGQAGFPLEFLYPKHGDEYLRIDTDGNLLVKRDDYWHNTYDLVEIRGERVNFIGRSDSILSIGGKKVDPIRIQSALLSIPMIMDAFVGGIPSSILGTAIVADVVMAGSEPFDEKAIRETLSRHVSKIEIPAIIRNVDRIKLNSNGKRTLGS